MPLDPAFSLDSSTGDFLAYAFKLATETDFPEDLQRLEITPEGDVTLHFSDGCNNTSVMLLTWTLGAVQNTVAVFFDDTYSWDVHKIGTLDYDDDGDLFVWYPDDLSISYELRDVETLGDAIARVLLEIQ